MDERAAHGWYAWAVPGVLMAAVGSLAIGTPGLWGDEFATWATAGQPWSRTTVLLREVDVVTAPYYAFIKAWAGVFGTSDVALRAPSAIAMAGAAALVGALGARLGGTRAGLVAGLLFAVLPGASRFAQEARVYALVVFAAVLATYLLVRLVERPARRWYLGYAAAVALVGLFHVVALLLLLGHGVVVLVRHRDLAPKWLAAAGAGVVPSLPLLWLGFGQGAQVAWIRRTDITVGWYLDTAFGGLLVAALIAALAAYARPVRPPGLLCAAWAVLPVLALLALWPVLPLLVPRYLMFTLPAWALLAGLAVARLDLALAIVPVLVVAYLAVPAHRFIRTDGGHEGAATRELAAIIERAYQPGDAIAYGLFDGDVTCCSWVPRDTLAHYVPADRRPRDAFLLRPARVHGALEPTECPDAAACLGDAPRVWVVRLQRHDDPLLGLGAGKERLIRDRYEVRQVWYPSGFTVAVAAARP